MPLPSFNTNGDLPSGIHGATLDEIVQRFGTSQGQRYQCTRRLLHVCHLARRTGCLRRVIIFGSYVTSKIEPNDIDVVLILSDDFRLDSCDIECRALFDHATAQARYGASIFWIRPSLLIGEGVEDFIAYWQTKRDGSKRVALWT